VFLDGVFFFVLTPCRFTVATFRLTHYLKFDVILIVHRR